MAQHAHDYLTLPRARNWTRDLLPMIQRESLLAALTFPPGSAMRAVLADMSDCFAVYKGFFDSAFQESLRHTRGSLSHRAYKAVSYDIACAAIGEACVRAADLYLEMF